MNRKPRKPPNDPCPAARGPGETESDSGGPSALGAAGQAGLQARVLVRPTILVGPQNPQLKLDGSTLRGVFVPGLPPPPADAESFGLETLPPTLVDELVIGPLPEAENPENYRGDDSPTLRLPPGVAADFELRREADAASARSNALNNALEDAATIALPGAVTQDAATVRLTRAPATASRPLPAPPAASTAVHEPAPALATRASQPPARPTLPPSAADLAALAARASQPPARPTLPPSAADLAALAARAAARSRPSQPERRARFNPAWAALIGLALGTLLLAYALTANLLARAPRSPRLQPALQLGPLSTPSAAAALLQSPAADSGSVSSATGEAGVSARVGAHAQLSRTGAPTPRPAP